MREKKLLTLFFAQISDENKYFLKVYIYTSRCSAACLVWKMANVESYTYIIKPVTIIAVLWAA